MGQFDIYDFLKDHPNKWFSSNDLVRELNLHKQAIVRCLRKLRDVKHIEINRAFVFRVDNKKFYCLGVRYKD